MAKLGRILKGNAQRLYIKGEPAERLELPDKGEGAFEVSYLGSGNTLVLFPQRLTLKELEACLDKLREKIKDQIQVDDLYQKI
jgi:hypothetical protein